MRKGKLLGMVRFWWVFQNPAKVREKEAEKHSSKQWWRAWHFMQFSSFHASKFSLSQVNSLTSLILSNHLHYKLLLLLITKAGKWGEGMSGRREKVKEFQSFYETFSMVGWLWLDVRCPPSSSITPLPCGTGGERE